MALVITGKSENNNTIIYIDDTNVEIRTISLNNTNVSDVIKSIKSKFGSNSSIIGTGPAADTMMPISTLFSTYPEGYPEYYCSRNGFGDIWGSKNLKAIVVNNDKYFKNVCFDFENFSIESKKLAKIIIENPICGEALPSNESITLIKLLNNKLSEESDSSLKNNDNKKPIIIKEESFDNKNIKLDDRKKINKTCSLLCVIGCLNRHCKNKKEVFSAPAESEVNSALIHCYNIEDFEFSKVINKKAFEMGIDSTEFIFSTNIYFKAINKVPTKKDIYNLLEEIEKNSIIGKIIASKTSGIYNLFRENKLLKGLVTKPVINEEKKFNISIKNLFKEFDKIDNLEFLYMQIFLLENMGFCIFTSFAIINSKEALDIIAKMFYYKTGIKQSIIEILNYSSKCIETEMEYEKNIITNSIKKNIPEFTKVLYRYFS